MFGEDLLKYHGICSKKGDFKGKEMKHFKWINNFQFNASEMGSDVRKRYSVVTDDYILSLRNNGDLYRYDISTGKEEEKINNTISFERLITAVCLYNRAAFIVQTSDYNHRLILTNLDGSNPIVSENIKTISRTMGYDRTIIQDPVTGNIAFSDYVSTYTGELYIYNNNAIQIKAISIDSGNAATLPNIHYNSIYYNSYIYSKVHFTDAFVKYNPLVENTIYKLIPPTSNFDSDVWVCNSFPNKKVAYDPYGGYMINLDTGQVDYSQITAPVPFTNDVGSPDNLTRRLFVKPISPVNPEKSSLWCSQSGTIMEVSFNYNQLTGINSNNSLPSIRLCTEFFQSEKPRDDKSFYQAKSSFSGNTVIYLSPNVPEFKVYKR